MRRTAWLGIAFLTTAVLASAAGASDVAIYLNPSASLESRIDDLLGRMTLEEKIALVHGNSTFSTAAIPRLGIPTRWLSDGPGGVREEISSKSWGAAGRTDDYSTWLPVPLCLAGTWDTDLAHDYGQVIGQEAKKRGKQIMLGPAMNIQRTPLCGRNAEYLGEDPWLASRVAVAYIQGEQSQGVASCAKHFACNNQETDRDTIDVEVDERALREIYLPAFRAAVQEGGVLAVMGAYNKLRGQHCCENDYLLNTILKGEWGFKGLVVSDWGGAHDTREAALNGLDLEMGTEKPFNKYFLADPFLDALKKGEIPMSVLDDKVRRNLRVMFLTHMFDVPSSADAGSINTKEHQTTARRVAEEGIVLLKNDQSILPLSGSKLTNIAVIGENAQRKLAYGGESAAIKAFYEITPLDGLVQRCGRQVNVNFSMGYSETLTSDAMIARAVHAAAESDVAIVFAGLSRDRFHDSEGSDRKDLKLPYRQNELIEQVVRANPRTIVVLIDGGAVEMPWIDDVPAILQAWYPGMEGGDALAGIIFGDVNPSGKLPCTFPRKLEDSPAHAMGNFPGAKGVVQYAEGILVGYRWFDAKEIEPLFPFGFGLSYTQFKYSNLKLIPGSDDDLLIVQCDITNIGVRDGAEVVELYIHPNHPSLPRPPKELKGFARISLKAGATGTITIPLKRSAFAYYDPAKRGWVAQKGDYGIEIGSSASDVRLQGDWKLDETTAEP